MAPGSSPTPSEIRSPEQDRAAAQGLEEVFDDASHGSLLRWRETGTKNIQDHRVGFATSGGKTPSDENEKTIKDNHSDKRSRMRKKKGTRKNRRHRHRVDNSDDENEKKMEGRRAYVFTMAASSLAWALALAPYWGIYCSHTALSMDALHIGYIFLIITVVLVTAHSSQMKDGKSPDSNGFRILQTLQVLVLVCLWAATFIPQRVCRNMSHLVVWTCAAGALFIIVISWALVFQHKTVIKCIKALCQMVVECRKALREMVINCTPNLSMPECISANFNKMPEENSERV